MGRWKVQWLAGYPAIGFVVAGVGGRFFAMHVLGVKKTKQHSLMGITLFRHIMLEERIISLL